MSRTCDNLYNLDRNRPALLQATYPQELSYKGVIRGRPVYNSTWAMVPHPTAWPSCPAEKCEMAGCSCSEL